MTYRGMNEGRLDFDSWYRARRPQVLVAVAIVCAGDHERAEDATNDAFVKAFERWDSVSSMESPSAWVTKVAINRAKRSYWRHSRRIDLLNSQRLATASLDDLPDIDLWQSVAALTQRQRKAIVLRYIDDLSQQEVAQELGVAVGTASATLSQARATLRSKLQTGERQ